MNARSLAAFSAVVAFVKPALAALPPDGAPLTTSAYAVDLYQGPVLSSTRVTGLAGAFVAIGEGVDGDTQNPAAPAVRVPWSTTHFDFDLGFGLTFPSTLRNSDFFNSGRRTDLPKGSTGGFVFLNIAANLQLGRWGLGVTSDLQEYALTRAGGGGGGDQLQAQIAVTHALLAYAFAEQQLSIGLGARTTTLSVSNDSLVDTSQRQLFTTFGAGFEAGLLWRPNAQPFRVGAAFRSAVTTHPADTNRATVIYADDPDNRMYLPERVTLPWDVNVGLAVQLGPRPFNPRWVDPVVELEYIRRVLHFRARERARRRQVELANVAHAGGDVAARARALDAELDTEAVLDDEALEHAQQHMDQQIRRSFQNAERFHVLFTSSLVLSGPTPDAVGIEAFLERRTQRSGPRTNVSPRAAIETETLPGWLRLRAGSYLEPSRFPSNPKGSRVHATLGFDQKLFPWAVFGLFAPGTAWRVSGSIDAARNYFGWSLALGVWH